MGRNKIHIDASEVERLVGEGQAEYQIAASLGVCQDTLVAGKREDLR